MPIDPNHVREMLARRLTQAQSAVAESEVVRIKEDIATQYPPASEPGTPPHRRTGNLQDGVFSVTENQGWQVVSNIASDRAGGDEHVPSYLEFGTSRMAPRPYMMPSKRRLRERALADLAQEAQL